MKLFFFFDFFERDKKIQRVDILFLAIFFSSAIDKEDKM